MPIRPMLTPAPQKSAEQRVADRNTSRVSRGLDPKLKEKRMMMQDPKTQLHQQLRRAGVAPKAMPAAVPKPGMPSVRPGAMPAAVGPRAMMAKGGKVSPATKAKAKAKVVKKGTMRKAPSRSR